MKITEDDVLRAIAAVPQAYGNSISNYLDRDVRPNWITRLFPALQVFQGVNVGHMYLCLMRLERNGLVSSEWGVIRYPERGNRRRRYYRLTDAGHKRLDFLIGCASAATMYVWP